MKRKLLWLIVIMGTFKVQIVDGQATSNAGLHACSSHQDRRNENFCGGVPNCLQSSNCTDGFCECATGHFGWLCEFATCDDYNRCQNDGECLIIENRHVCSCTDDYSGEIYMCNNLTNCNGECLSKQFCQCNPALRAKYGSACTADCDIYNPCKNGGICSVVGGKYVCDCPDLFTGTRCERMTCNSTWCPGICVEDECMCPPGWKGDRCQFTDCKDFPACDGVGVCDDSYNDIRCICDKHLYGGKYCEYNCSRKCVYGLCGADEKCYCDKGYTGDKCDTILQPFQMSRTFSNLNYLIIILLGILFIVLYIVKVKRDEGASDTYKFDNVMSRYQQNMDYDFMKNLQKM